MDEGAGPAPTVPASVVAAAVSKPVEASKDASRSGNCFAQIIARQTHLSVYLLVQVDEISCGSSHSLAILSEYQTIHALGVGQACSFPICTIERA